MDNSYQEEFEQRAITLRIGLGAIYGCEKEWRKNKPPKPGAYHYDLPFFKDVKLPFSPSDWCDLCMRDGRDYLGGCCSLLTSVQDLLNACFREGGIMSVQDIATIADVMHRHGEDADCGEYEEDRWESFKGDNNLFKKLFDDKSKCTLLAQSPMERLRHIWHVIDGFSMKAPSIGRWSPIDEPEASFLVLADQVFLSSMRRLYYQDIQAERTIFEGTDLAQIAHALAITEKIVPFDFQWEGFCLYDPENDRVVQTRRLCLYETEEEALKELEPFKNYYRSLAHPEKLNKPLDNETLVVRKIRITKRGTELL